MPTTEGRPPAPARTACLIAPAASCPWSQPACCYFIVFRGLTVNQTLLASLLFVLIASAYLAAVLMLVAPYRRPR